MTVKTKSLENLRDNGQLTPELELIILRLYQQTQIMTLFFNVMNHIYYLQE
jgi:hypothetical protein